jgi:hypothetical protein
VSAVIARLPESSASRLLALTGCQYSARLAGAADTEEPP